MIFLSLSLCLFLFLFLFLSFLNMQCQALSIVPKEMIGNIFWNH